MNLANLRNLLRPLVSSRNEYRIRRELYRLLPVRNHAPAGHAVHACVWKTGTQWIRLILSDPAVYRQSGYSPFVFPQVRGSAKQRQQLLASDRTVLLNTVATHETVTSMLGTTDFRAIFVVRDPRNLLVSWYLSTRYTHESTPGVDRRREAMSGMTDEEGLLWILDDFVKDYPPLINSWLNEKKLDSNVKIIQFEDLTGRDNLPVWEELLTHFDIEISRATLEKLLQRYSIDVLKSVKSQNGGQKYGGAGKRDWRDYFSKPIAEAFTYKTDNLAGRMGYEHL